MRFLTLLIVATLFGCASKPAYNSGNVVIRAAAAVFRFAAATPVSLSMEKIEKWN